MVADRDLEIDVLKEITRKKVGARVRRQQVAYAQTRGLDRLVLAGCRTRRGHAGVRHHVGRPEAANMA
jgi:hypothetical protein